MGKLVAAKGFKSCPKSNKLPNLVTLLTVFILGLPVPSAGGDVTVNPLTDLILSEESDIVSASGRRSTTLSPLRTSTVSHVTSSGLGDMSSGSFLTLISG